MRNQQVDSRSIGTLPRRVIITGGAGFIGSHLADALIERGNSVVVIDDLSTGSVDNLHSVRDHPRFALHVGSATDGALLEELFAHADACVHLAAVVGVKLVLRQPAHALDVNARTAEAVFEVAARHRVPVLVASTSEVYGSNLAVPFHEDAALEVAARSSTHSSYAVSKLYCERLALDWQRQAGLPVLIVRLFNTSGPRQIADHGMVLPTFAQQALAGRPLTVFGDGGQTRCFAHVRDTTEALLRLLGLPAAVGEIFNVGSDHEVSILQLAECVKQRAGSDSTIIRVPYREAYGEGFEDMLRRVPGLTKVQALTGIRPTAGLDEIIDDVLAYWAGRPVDARPGQTPGGVKAC